ncbi:hypothetical protein FGADI_3768 [Fusarium gaditjirri]|uniref:BTB domain-containing protein n=1 Tax=Fusarium gaditjirri TaxID=282569 RepID=A0A8H4TEU6_9HYPO|nr:hypothetical protein FGADI_3768 [Fusarium gaditjirri]
MSSQFESEEETVEIRFKVSSHHMKLASPVFDKMLNGPWSESTSPKPTSTPASTPEPASLGSSDGSVGETAKVSPVEKFPSSSAITTSPSWHFPTREVIAHAWNPDALLLVLNVIHGMNDEFPLVTSVEFLAEVAAVTDYYQCQRGMQLAAEVWRQTMYGLPLRYGKRCVLWLSIAWCFGWKDVFFRLAHFFIQHSEGLYLIKSNALPVIAILEILDAKRQECITRVITRLTELAEQLLDGRAGCGHRCSSMLLGSLLRERQDLSLLDPELPSPYTGYSFYEYTKKIASFRVMDWGYIGWEQSATAHNCTIMTLMEPLLKSIDADIKDFDISKAGFGYIGSNRQWTAHEASEPEPPRFSRNSRFFPLIHLLPPHLNLNIHKNPSTMKTISYVVDPDGDFVFVLTEPNCHQVIPKIQRDGLPTRANLPDSDFDNPPLTGRYTIFNDLYNKEATSSDTEDAEDIHEPCEVRMIVSSEHMCSTSTFMDLLVASVKSAGSYSPSPSCQPLYEMHTTGWDAMALAIVLDTIHGRDEGIPEFIGLGLLIHITAVAEFYECQASMHISTNLWKRDIMSKGPLPTDFCQKALLWLYFSWVFPGQKSLFPSMARCILRDFKGISQINLRMLPLQQVLGKLDAKRIELIGQIKEGLEDVRNTLSTETICAAANSYSCPPQTLGSLIQMMREDENDQDSPLISPFHMRSVSRVIKMVQLWPELIPFHCAHKRFDSLFISPNNGEIYPCSIKGRMAPVFDKVEQAIQSLCVADFKG